MKRLLNFVLMFMIASALLVGISFGAGEERFILSDLTVKDEKTGLMWTRDANIAGKKMSWFNAFRFIEKLNSQGYAGYSDWVLPAKEELQTLVDYAKIQGYGYNKGLYELFGKLGFKNTRLDDIYWSSTTATSNKTYAWFLSMLDVDVFEGTKLWEGYVLPVRGEKTIRLVSGISRGVIKKRFEFSDLTAKDKKTRLIWTKDGDLTVKPLTLAEAYDFIKQLNNKEYAGYSDWRLPTKEELQTLIDFAKSKGYNEHFYVLFNNIGFKKLHMDFYWSSTAGILTTTVTTFMVDGYMLDHMPDKSYVWPVRAGQ